MNVVCRRFCLRAKARLVAWARALPGVMIRPPGVPIGETLLIERLKARVDGYGDD
jgi:hypothetical protein